MALVKGTNCGFVTVAPVADPNESNAIIDSSARGFKDVAPAGAVRVTEIGWWCDDATEAADFDVGIYNHDAVNNRPDILIGSSVNNPKGLTAGWKVISGLNIAVTPGTIYWLGVQLDNTAMTTNTNSVSTADEKNDRKINQTSLPSPWGASDVSYAMLIAFYAVVEISAPPAAAPKFGSLNRDFYGPPQSVGLYTEI
jgi:hypothetical protein